MAKRTTTTTTPDNTQQVPKQFEEMTSGAHLDLYIQDSNRPKGEAKANGIQLMSSADINEEIKNIAITGADQNGTMGTSYYEEKRIHILRRLFLNPSSLFRMHVFGSKAMLIRLNTLRMTCPQFGAVIDYAVSAATTSMITHTPLYLQPMILVGAPGIGKTHFAEALSAALGVHCARISATALSHSGRLTGYGTAWQGAGPGVVAKALLTTRVTCPVVLVDEIDKMVPGPAQENQTNAFLPLLEPTTSCRYIDEYLGIPMRADSIIWIMTANEFQELPSPFLDRLLIFYIKMPSKSQRHAIIEQIFEMINKRYSSRLGTLDAAAFSALSDLNIRSANRALELAVVYAISQKQLRITPSNIEAALAVVGRTAGGSKHYGFVRHE